MGILADLFVATRDDALRYKEAQGSPEVASDRYEIAQYKGFTTLEFGTLWAILAGTSWNVERHMLTNLAHGEDGETWLDEFPAEYVALLASLGESSLADAADVWGETEELQCSGEELLPIVKDLQRLARLSDAHRGLFLWGSL